MLKKLEEKDFDKHVEFAHSLALDQSKSAYPTYTDGIKTKEDFITRAKKAFARENEEILLFEVAGKVEGWIHYFVLEEDKYISFCAFNVNDHVEIAIKEFLEHISHNYRGCTLYFGLPTVNVSAISCLEKIGFDKDDECYVDVMYFDKYQPIEETAGIVQVTKENYSEFAKLHAASDEEMYWNTERIFENLDDWHIYLCYTNDELAGAIYYNYCGTSMEIFGVDFPNDSYDETTFKALLIKALNEGKKDGCSDLTFFNGECEHSVVSELGFTHVGEYVLYTQEV